VGGEPIVGQILRRQIDGRVVDDAALSAHCQQPVGLRARGQRREPVVADDEIAGKKVEGRDGVLGVVAHHARAVARQRIALHIALDESPHLVGRSRKRPLKLDGFAFARHDARGVVIPLFDYERQIKGTTRLSNISK